MPARGFSGVLLVTTCWLAGIAVARWLALPLWPAVLVAAFSLGLAVALRQRNSALLLLAFFALGMVRLQLPPAPRSLGSVLGATPAFQQSIRGTITAGPTPREHSFRYELALREVNGQRVRGKVLYYAPRGDLRPGDGIENLARVQETWRRANFATFDYEESMAARGIQGIAFARGVVRITSRGRGPRAWLASARGWIAKRIDQRCGEYAALARSFLLGQTEVDDLTRDTMRRAGLAHLLAVSGLHVFVIGLAISVLLGVLLPWRPAAWAASLSVMLFYAALCGWRPSVTRAVVMLAFVTMGRLLQRRTAPMHTLALSAFAVTLWQPRQLFMPGFQLSYLAVVALVLLVPPVLRFVVSPGDGKLSCWRKILRFELGLAVSSVGIALALAPVTLFHFQSLSLNGVAANLLAVPIFWVLLPLTILVVLAPPWSWLLPVLRSAFFLVADALRLWSAACARLPLQWEQLGLPVWRAWVWLLALAALALLLRARTARWRWGALACLALACTVGLMPVNTRQDELRLTFVHVGMGDMALLELPTGQAIAIDTGPDEEESGHVSQSLLPYLAREGIGTLDAVFVTHAHDDHFGGLAALCRAVRVRRIVVGDETAQRLPWLCSLATAEGAALEVLADRKEYDYGDVRLRVLHPDSLFRAGSVNDESLVIRLDYREFSALFAGDLEQPGEEWLLSHCPGVLDVDVLKVGHHGSATSSSTPFIRAVSPEYAFIPAPLHNVHRLPHQAALDRLQLGDNLFIAGRDGALRIETDGHRAELTSVLREGRIEDADL